MQNEKEKHCTHINRMVVVSGGWLSLINRQGIERGKAGEELLTLERNTACGDKGGIIKARLSFQTCPTNGFLFLVS